MKSKEGINILFTDKALAFIKTRRLTNPLVLVNLGYRSGGDEQSGCGGGGCSGGGGGGCGGESGSACIPFANVVMVDGGQPGDDFVKMDTAAGVPVYLAKALLQRAKKSGSPILITLKGMVMKKLSVEGLELTPPPAEQEQEQENKNCH